MMMRVILLTEIQMIETMMMMRTEIVQCAVMSPGSSDQIGFSSLVTIELPVSDNVTMCGVPVRRI